MIVSGNTVDEVRVRVKVWLMVCPVFVVCGVLRGSVEGVEIVTLLAFFSP